MEHAIFLSAGGADRVRRPRTTGSFHFTGMTIATEFLATQQTATWFIERWHGMESKKRFLRLLQAMGNFKQLCLSDFFQIEKVQNCPSITVQWCGLRKALEKERRLFSLCFWGVQKKEKAPFVFSLSTSDLILTKPHKNTRRRYLPISDLAAFFLVSIASYNVMKPSAKFSSTASTTLNVRLVSKIIFIQLGFEKLLIGCKREETNQREQLQVDEKYGRPQRR